MNTTLRYASPPSQTTIPYQARHLDQLLTTHHQDRDTDTVDQDHSPIPADITVTVAMIHTDAIPGHVVEVTIGVLHDALTPVLIIPAVTSHIADHPHTGPHQITLGIIADHIPVQHTNHVSKL